MICKSVIYDASETLGFQQAVSVILAYETAELDTRRPLITYSYLLVPSFSDTAYAKNKDDGKWYNFDDSSVSPANEDQIVVSDLICQKRATYYCIHLRQFCWKGNRMDHFIKVWGINYYVAV